MTGFLDLQRFVPGSSPTDDNIVTWSEHNHGSGSSQTPECSSHHTYVETVPVDRFDVWVCPACGRFSDAYTGHAGGTHITAPVNFDPDEAIIVVGNANVPPSPEESGFGDETIRAALVSSPYAAKEDLKAFKSDAEWPRPSRRFRRWVPEWNVWAVRRSVFGEFIDHMAGRGWIVIDLPQIQSEANTTND